MLKGIVLFYLADKLYGFIRVPDTMEEFHFSGKKLTAPLVKGDAVSFDLKEGKQGLIAVNIQKLDS